MASDKNNIFAGQLPSDFDKIEVLNVMKILEARGADIAEMFEILKKNPKKERAFQKLPFSMRRRAMSHNPFRVPKNIRIHIVKEMAKNNPKAAKRLKKEKRKKLNRLLDYQNRCKKHQWLETHIFHAKRFKMVNIWGYRLAESATQKCKRKCLRYAKRMCLIHDKSYTKIVSLTGVLDKLSTSLDGIIQNPSRLFSDPYLSGDYMGLALVCNSTRADEYSMVCLVNFIWKPATEMESQRTIYFLIHPSNYDAFLQLASQFQNITTKQHPNISYYELYGPMSHLFLRCALKVNADDSNGNHYWKNTSPKANQIPPAFVLPLKVRCPPIYGALRPSYTVTMMEQIAFKNQNFDFVNLEAERMEFFDYDHKDKANFVTKFTVPRRRRKNYAKIVSRLLSRSIKVPKNTGDHNTSHEDDDSALKCQEATTAAPESMDLDKHGNIPILLIPKKYPTGGFDLLMPSGICSKNVWMLLHRYGALAVGLLERELVLNSFGHICYPRDFPETDSGHDLFLQVKCQEAKKYLQRPEAKRPNYGLMGIDCAFDMPHLNGAQEKCSFNLPFELTANGSMQLLKGDVISSRFLLVGMVDAGLLLSPQSRHNITVWRLTLPPSSRVDIHFKLLLEEIRKQILYGNRDFPSNYVDSNAYISVRVTPIRRGRVDYLTRIYLPTIEDLKQFNIRNANGFKLQNGSHNVFAENLHLVEPVHSIYKVPHLKSIFSSHIKSKTLTKIKASQMVEDLRRADHKTIRQCVGFVTTKECFKSAHACIHISAFLTCLRNMVQLSMIAPQDVTLKTKAIVLFRNCTSREYHAAIASIQILDVTYATV